jgi:hypothetical protein
MTRRQKAVAKVPPTRRWERSGDTLSLGTVERLCVGQVSANKVCEKREMEQQLDETRRTIMTEQHRTTQNNTSKQHNKTKHKTPLRNIPAEAAVRRGARARRTSDAKTTQ